MLTFWLVVGCVGGVIIIVIIIVAIVLLTCSKPREKRKHSIHNSDDIENGNGKRICIRNTILDFTDKPKGLPNIGETCYVNSMVQCLAWSPCLRLQLEDQIRKQNFSQHGNKVAKSLLTVLESYHDEDEGDVVGKSFDFCYRRRNNLLCDELSKFLSAIYHANGRFSAGEQEDTYEFFNTLISTIQDEALEHIPRTVGDETYDEHVMRYCGTYRLFGGKFITTYCYEDCGHVEPVYQAFTSLSIPVTAKPDIGESSVMIINEDQLDRMPLYPGPDAGILKHTHTKTIDILVKPSLQLEDKLQRRLSLSMKHEDKSLEETCVELGLETLTGTEKMMASEIYCRSCRKQGRSGTEGALYKTLQILSLPPVLVLQINRFKQRGHEVYKMTEPVSYPKVLDMARFCSIAMEQVSGASGKLTPGETYSLFGVVNHLGSIQGGHYFADIKTTQRNVANIQSQLQNYTWRDPERMADSIRKHLEEIWREINRFEGDSNEKYFEQQQLLVGDRQQQSAYQNTKEGSDTWFRVNDSSVEKVEEDIVMQSKNAYILMYERM
ncbi:uncharacterized protein LOC132559605 [Ylistrum balloti]|uniref:uncharacterized protein LOC132559605 n=1 Tax=Ylistrum balloti TaxID=509963 RepID=UPI002905A741|nr:uncharacterized protein LOC132559605 [Ylistrum balloti]